MADKMTLHEAQLKTFAALEKGDIAAALSLHDTFEGRTPDVDEDDIARIEPILDPSFQPRAFQGTPVKPGIRICAAALALWGEGGIRRIEGARRFIDLGSSDPDDVMLMLSAGIEKAQLVEFAWGGITRVEVCGSGTGDDARACAEDDGKVYSLPEAPELPHAVGEDEHPCRCVLIAAT